MAAGLGRLRVGYENAVGCSQGKASSGQAGRTGKPVGLARFRIVQPATLPTTVQVPQDVITRRWAASASPVSTAIRARAGNWRSPHPCARTAGLAGRG